MWHQKASPWLECHAVDKNAVNLGVWRSRNSVPGGTVSSEEGRGSGCAWGKPRCLAFWKMPEVFGLVLVGFCWSPVSVPTRAVFSGDRGQGHFWRLSSPAYTFVAFVGRSIFLFSPWTVSFQCWLPWDEGFFKRHWMQMMRWFSNPGSAGEYRPCLDGNTLWSVQLEPSISLLELSSQESYPGSALSPRHCSISSQGLLCFNSVFKSTGCYLHLPSSVTYHLSPFHHGEGIRKWILWLRLYISTVISSTFYPDLGSLLSSVPQGKALALSSEIS